MVMGGRELRRERDGALALRNGILEPPGESRGVAEIAEHDRIVGGEPRRSSARP